MSSPGADPQISIVSATVALLEAALEGDASLATALAVAVIPGWQVFEGALPGTLEQLRARPELEGWWTHFFVSPEPRTLVGWGGLKGPPSERGEVEIGYAIAPAMRGRGFATAAARALVERAFADPRVRRVVAHTLAEENASTRVLGKLGFRRVAEIDSGDDGPIFRWAVERE